MPVSSQYRIIPDTDGYWLIDLYKEKLNMTPSGNTISDAKDNAIEELQDKIESLQRDLGLERTAHRFTKADVEILKENGIKYEKQMELKLKDMELKYLKEFKLRIEQNSIN